MDLDTCIKGRRSVRAYTEESVSKEQVDEVLEAAVWAPSGMGRQPWRFVIVENKDLIKLASDETKEQVKKNMPPLAAQFSTDKDIICYNAPMLILICTEKDPQWANVNLLDSVLAAQNIFLKAHELGLGTCYMGFMQFLSSNPEVLYKLGMSKNCELMVPLIIGHPKTKTDTGKRQKPIVTSWAK